MANLKRGPVQGKAEISDVNPISKNVKAYQKLDVDFIVDRPGNEQTVRALILVNTYTCACLGLKLETSLGSGGATKALGRPIVELECPERMYSDNSLEFTSRQIRDGAKERHVKLVHPPALRPVRKGHIERLLEGSGSIN